MDFKKSIKYFWAIVFFGWAIVILIVSVMPTSGIQPETDNERGLRLDYLIHLVIFIILALLFGFWRSTSAAAQKRREILWFLAGGSAYAALTEVVQLFVEGRTYNPLDLMYNVMGVFAGTLLAWWFIIRPSTKKNNR